jgi:hypothetical protein
MLLLALCTTALAQDQRFALRVGAVYMDPTSDTTFKGSKSELESAGGIELMFEWYMLDWLGLELSAAGAADVDVEEDNDPVGGVSVAPLTLGLNAHLVRNRGVDWWVGLVGGQVIYGDFDFEGDNEEIDTENDMVWGVQTAVDLAPPSWCHWAFNLGVKYLKTGVETDEGSIDIDPLVYRLLLTFRW